MILYISSHKRKNVEGVYKMKLYIILIFFILSAQTALAKDLLLLGGSNHDEFLGCLVCNEYSSSSPWNEYSSSDSVPIVVDRQGNFYGYFTINAYRSNAVDFANQLYKIFQMHNGDVEEVRKTLCELLN